MPEYYDYVLVLIPVALVGVTVGLGAVGVDPMAALPVGAAAASAVTGHALFVNCPVDSGSERRSRASSNHSVNAD